MWELLRDLFFNWPAVMERGADSVAYLVLALLGTILFLLRLTFAMFVHGDGGDFDTDVSDVDSDVSFTYFSTLSILAFFMGAGWMGLACRIDWEMGRFASSVSSAGFGFAMMLAASGLAYLTRRMNRQIDYDLNTAVGRTARVYLTIPAKGKGHGQVEVTVSGRRKILPAMSAGGKLEAFTDVKVLEVRDDETLLVEPFS